MRPFPLNWFEELNVRGAEAERADELNFMALALGTRLGPYEVTALINRGGMGEVHRAHDINLNRDVALKILPEEFALDAERLARFKREAQVLASLNHPNIAVIYGLEEALVQRQMLDCCEAICRNVTHRPAESLTLRACPLQARSDTF